MSESEPPALLSIGLRSLRRFVQLGTRRELQIGGLGTQCDGSRFQSTLSLDDTAASGGALATYYSASHYDSGFSALLDSRTPMILFTGQFVDCGECQQAARITQLIGVLLAAGLVPATLSCPR
jgi:hypothetical protein